MEALLLFLANAIASGAVGHYVSKSLAKLDKELPELLEGETDLSAAEKLIHDKGLEGDISDIAKKVMAESVVIPVLSDQGAKNHDKLEQLRLYINVCYAVSHRLKFDLLIPSSLASAHAFTAFMGNEHVAHEVALAEGEIRMVLPAAGRSSQMRVFPITSDERKNKTWNDYKEYLSEAREETNNYLRPLSLFMNKGYPMRAITAGSCEFDRTVANARVSDRAALALTHVGSGTAPKARMANRFQFMKAVVSSIKEVATVGYLSEDELKRMRKAYKDLESILDVPNQVS